MKRKGKRHPQFLQEKAECKEEDLRISAESHIKNRQKENKVSFCNFTKGTSVGEVRPEEVFYDLFFFNSER